MNVLFLTLLDFDSIQDKGIYTDLMREFVRNGNNVYIVSPTEKRNRAETRLIVSNEVSILKIKIGNIQKTSYLEKGLSMISLEKRFISGIKKYFNNVKFDLVLYSTPPVTLLDAVNYVRKRDASRTYLLLKDIFPQNAVDLGLLKKSGLKGVIYRFFKRKEQKLYEVSDFIGCMSVGNAEYIIENNPDIDPLKVEVCPNSIEPNFQGINVEERSLIRIKWELPLHKTIFIYGGNLGKPQGVDFLIEIIKANEHNQETYILVVGSGTEYIKLKKHFVEEKPQNAKLITQLDKKEYERLVCSSDVGLVFLDKRFTIPNFPSRILSYMNAGMPILSATDISTDVGKVIEQGGFGYWCESGNVKDFCDLMDKLKNNSIRSKMGINSRQYLMSNYTVSHSYREIIKHFNE